jgi:hypothetical protein
VVQECKSVSIPFLRKEGFLCGYCSGAIVWTDRFGEETASMSVVASTRYGNSYLRLIYTMTDRNTGEETPFDYKVPLASTPCHFGGVRWWFVCALSRNGVSCGRRVGTIYRPPRADYYGCQHCYDLSYESRNRTRSGMFAAYGGVLRVDRQMEELRSQINRWTYQGRPTRKVRKLQALAQRMESYSRASQKFLCAQKEQQHRFLEFFQSPKRVKSQDRSDRV